MDLVAQCIGRFSLNYCKHHPILDNLKLSLEDGLRYRSLPEFDSQVLTITKNAAEICYFDIHYRSDLNWQTYEAVLRFSELLKNELTKAELKPRDMIDVRSFMWCIRPDKTVKTFGRKKRKQTNEDESEGS